jgi:hypothetical protein
MSCIAKAVSEEAGRRFLQEAFLKQQRLLQAQLELAESSITHNGKRGDVTEQHFIEMLGSYLPRRYSVDSAIVIDSEGKTSDQMDIVIYDWQYTPTLLDQRDHKYVPVEAVYAVLEVKPTINKSYLTYAGEKAESVRRLKRTSVAIPHAGGEFPPKRLHEIIAGLVAPRIDWQDGFGAAFLENIRHLDSQQRLDCILAVDRASCDFFEHGGSPTVSPGRNALVFFLFRLLQKLQSLGTVPAIDWNAYAEQLAEEDEIEGGSHVQLQ